MTKIKGIKYISPLLDNCYDEKTEVLTDSGWKFFKDVSYEDCMATIDPNGELEYNTPEQLIIHDWDGDMYKFKSNQSKIDLLVTPNHNMYVQTEHSNRKSKTYGWKFETAEKVFGKNRYFKKNVKYVKKDLEYITISNTHVRNDLEEVYNRKIKTDHWMEFLGYYISEGSTTLTKPKKNYIIQIRQFGVNINKMAEALSKITVGTVNIREEDGRILVHDKELALYLKREFGNKYSKNIPRYLLNNCSKRQLTILFEALMLGDGHDQRGVNKEEYGNGGSSYCTASLQLRDDFMELLFKIGYSGSYVCIKKKGEEIIIYDRVCKCRADNWNIYIKFKNNIVGKYKEYKFEEKKVNYKGKVYCVTVQNHTLYVRRNGGSVWCGNSGYAKASRGNVLALHKLGIPLTLSPISFEKARPDLGADGEILNGLINKDIDYNVVLINTTPEFWSKHKEPDKINVGFTYWETSKLHPDWLGYINNNVQKVLVGCSWNKDVFKESGVEIPIGVIPCGIDIEVFNDIELFQVAGVSKDAYVFYDIFQWNERKNPLALIKAYWYEFKEEDNVALVLKTYRSSYDEAEKNAIRTTIKRLKMVTPMDYYPPIYLIPNILSEDEILSLHTRGDCYASLDRGEGFGLSHFTAGATGNPLIATGFGGVTGYAKKDNSYLVDYTLTPVYGMPWSPWYRGDQLWAEPDILHGAKLMRYVYENREESKACAQKLKEYISENFTWEVIGKKLIEEIEKI